MNLYRAMIVKTVILGKDYVDLSFEDSMVSLIISEPWFTEKKLRDLKVGQRIFIKGRGQHGNEDCMLFSLSPLEDLVVA